jgi:hypothetical protein
MKPLENPSVQRSDKGRTKLTSRDAWTLQQVGEQGAIRLDQLRGLLGQMPQRATHETGLLRLTTVRRIVGRWEALGLAKSKLVFARQPAWVYLTHKGLREFNLPYREVSPSAALAMHYYWVNQVYFWVRRQYSDDRWISERRLRKEREGPAIANKHIPDAEIHRYDRNGELTVIAVEVELTIKERQRSLAIMQELAASYDGIWYFTNDVTDASVKRTLAQLDEEVSSHFRIRDLTKLP